MSGDWPLQNLEGVLDVWRKRLSVLSPEKLHVLVVQADCHFDVDFTTFPQIIVGDPVEYILGFDPVTTPDGLLHFLEVNVPKLES